MASGVMIGGVYAWVYFLFIIGLLYTSKSHLGPEALSPTCRVELTAEERCLGTESGPWP